MTQLRRKSESGRKVGRQTCRWHVRSISDVPSTKLRPTRVGGGGTGACSGDFLLGALAACAQITCQMVAAAMGIPTERIEVTVEGDLDLGGTLGISKDVPSALRAFNFILTLMRPRQRRNNCVVCERKQNSIAW
jgi:hypothetical protein